MSELYTSLAASLEQLAAGYRALAGTDSGSASTTAPAPAHTVTIEEVRAVLAEKSSAGKTREIKALLMKYDAGKLSGVKPEDYPALLQEARAL